MCVARLSEAGWGRGGGEAATALCVVLLIAS